MSKNKKGFICDKLVKNFCAEDIFYLIDRRLGSKDVLLRTGLIVVREIYTGRERVHESKDRDNKNTVT